MQFLLQQDTISQFTNLMRDEGLDYQEYSGNQNGVLIELKISLLESWIERDMLEIRSSTNPHNFLHISDIDGSKKPLPQFPFTFQKQIIISPQHHEFRVYCIESSSEDRPDDWIHEEKEGFVASFHEDVPENYPEDLMLIGHHFQQQNFECVDLYENDFDDDEEDTYDAEELDNVVDSIVPQNFHSDENQIPPPA